MIVYFAFGVHHRKYIEASEVNLSSILSHTQIFTVAIAVFVALIVLVLKYP